MVWTLPVSSLVAFLSCLCGSEHENGANPTDQTFLSCLCGSEPRMQTRRKPSKFLSCLCGSEP